VSYTPAELRNLRTLSTGACCDLKIQRNAERVWLCCRGGVTLERKTRSGKWYVSEGGCHPPIALAV
jgi:hypothetical protein